MKHTPIKVISDKRRAELLKYKRLLIKLWHGCNNKSELSGKNPDWQSNYQVDPHHIAGRLGALLYDPFNIIMLTRPEHDVQEGKTRGDKIPDGVLRNIVRPIRTGQGFKQNE